MMNEICEESGMSLKEREGGGKEGGNWDVQK
jgi:hypothetical protein